MPPRKAAKKVDEDDDLSAEDLGSDASDFEEERRRKPAKKRASKAGESKARGTLTEGWEAVPDCLILVHKDPEMPPADKVAAFDFDATLVTTKSGVLVPKDEHDFKLVNNHVGEKLKGFVEEGYAIVVFTNQGSIKTALTGKAANKLTKRMDNVFSELGIQHYHAVMATADKNMESNFRKGSGTGMFDYFVEHMNGGVRPGEGSFFVGDAGGREADFAATDKEFAEACGLEYRTPEDVFGEIKVKKQALPGAGQAVLRGEESTGPNAPLVNMMQQYRELCFKSQNLDPKLKFKGIALGKAIKGIESVPHAITSGKEAQKIQGIGKGLGEEIDQFLETGSFPKMESLLEQAGKGPGSPAIKKKLEEKAKETGAFDFV